LPVTTLPAALKIHKLAYGVRKPWSRKVGFAVIDEPATVNALALAHRNVICPLEPTVTEAGVAVRGSQFGNIV